VTKPPRAAPVKGVYLSPGLLAIGKRAAGGGGIVWKFRQRSKEDRVTDLLRGKNLRRS